MVTNFAIQPCATSQLKESVPELLLIDMKGAALASSVAYMYAYMRTRQQLTLIRVQLLAEKHEAERVCNSVMGTAKPEVDSSRKDLDSYLLE